MKHEVTITPETISTVSNEELKSNYEAANHFLKTAEAEETQDLCYMKAEIEKECFKRKYNLK